MDFKNGKPSETQPKQEREAGDADTSPMQRDELGMRSQPVFGQKT
jgi:hypothetical protein